MNLKIILREVPDPRGKQGRDYRLWSILGLIVVSLLCGRRGLRAAFFLGRGLSLRQRRSLGFSNGKTPCHATLTETLRVIDAAALADILGAACPVEGEDRRHIRIDGKTMRASKDGEGHATHVLSAFCAGLQSVLGHEASRGKGMEIPDALKLLDRLDLKGKIVTGDAMFCQKSIAAKIVEKGGDGSDDSVTGWPANRASTRRYPARGGRAACFRCWILKVQMSLKKYATPQISFAGRLFPRPSARFVAGRRIALPPVR